MDIAGVDLPVFNVERDQDQVMLQDVKEAPAQTFDAEEGEATSSTSAAGLSGDTAEASAAAASDNTQSIPSAEAQTVAAHILFLSSHCFL